MAEDVKQSEGRSKERPSGIARRERWSAPMAFTPFSLMRHFADEMDRAFEGFGWPAMGWQQELTKGGWSPQVEMFEREGNLVVRADLPGLKKDEVSVEFREDALIIEGERKQEQKEEREGYYHSERRYGRFFRSVPLPEGINPEQASATFQDGVLEIQVPIPEHTTEQRGRRIEIR